MTMIHIREQWFKWLLSETTWPEKSETLLEWWKKRIVNIELCIQRKKSFRNLDEIKAVSDEKKLRKFTNARFALKKNANESVLDWREMIWEGNTVL